MAEARPRRDGAESDGRAGSMEQGPRPDSDSKLYGGAKKYILQRPRDTASVTLFRTHDL